MANCNKCGAEIGIDASFCGKCGASVDPVVSNSDMNSNFQTYVSTYQAGSYSPPKPEIDNTAVLIWAIITTICCCLPFGIAGIIYACKVKSAATYEEAQKALSTAKILCIIGLIGGIVIGIISMGFGMLGAILDGSR